MRILFWLEPHYDLLRPGVMKTWLGCFERIAEALRQTSYEIDYRIVCLDSPAASARAGALGERLILLSQAELLAQWRVEGNAFIQLEHDRVPADVSSQLLIRLRERLGNFDPDFVFLLNQQSWLRRGFPNALFVNIELSWTSRAPFPTTWQLDIVGAGKGRVLADNTDRLLETLPLDREANDFVESVRAIAHERLTCPTAKSFVQTLREKYAAVTLLPIPAFDHSDGRVPFFAALDKFLAEQGGESALLLTQHPMWQLLSVEQLAYLVSKYPYVIDCGELGGQRLLPWTDCVVADFSTLATQSLLFDTRVVSVGRELMNCPVDLRLNPLVDILTTSAAYQRKKIIYWLMTRYAVPEAKIFDGAWLLRFLSRAAEVVQAGKPWAAYEEQGTTIEDWEKSAWRSVPTPSASNSEARLYFSELIDGTPTGYSDSRSIAIFYPLLNRRQIQQLGFPSNLKPISSEMDRVSETAFWER